MNPAFKMAVIAVLGLAAMNLPSGSLRAQPDPVRPQPCPSAGTYTADVDGAPEKGACRQPLAEAAPAAFDIPPGPLFQALEAFLKQSGSRGWVPLDLMVSGTRTPGVSGTMPPSEAIGRLLAGTNVSYVQDQTGTLRFPVARDTPTAGARCIWNKAPDACAG